VDGSDAPSKLPSLARTPTGYVVVWLDGENDDTVRARGLDLDGAPIGDGAVTVLMTSFDARPVVADSPQGVVISWMDKVDDVGSVHVSYLDDELQLVGTPVQLGSPTNASFPWLTGGADGVSAVWSDDSTGVMAPHFSRLFTDLTPKENTPLRDP